MIRKLMLLVVGVILAMLVVKGVAVAWETPNGLAHESSVTTPEVSEPAGHEDPVTPLLLGISVILLAAKVGGDLMVRMKQPAVLGELLVGVVLGNLVLLGFESVEFLRPATGHGEPLVLGHGGLAATTLDMLARIGVILLLFEVGLESNLKDMRRVGMSSLIVAVLGVVAPMILGWGVAIWLLPDHSWHVHLFIAATLCATSVGITVSNDTTAPTVTVTSPASGAAVTGTIMLRAAASDNVGVAGVQFTLDGVNLGAESTVVPYQVTWNSATVANGAHVLSAVARDAAGNQQTVSVNLIVANVVP